jgi:hypothetical protein
MVIACIAVAPASAPRFARPAVPSLIRFVSAARYASGDSASLPYASAVHTE